MAVSLMTSMELTETPAPLRNGLLARAMDLPSGWQSGIVVPFYGCGEPILRNKCVQGVDEPHRDGNAEFGPFMVEQGASCSTMGGENLTAHAENRLLSTTEWALARQLQTDVAQTNSPALDDAVSIGTATDWVNAVAQLEQYAADTGFGTPWVIHAPVFAAAYLESENQIVDGNGTPGGGSWIISPGYTLPAAGSVRLWVTGPVWADVSDTAVRENVAHRQNDIAAWADLLGLVAFNPCMNGYIDVTV